MTGENEEHISLLTFVVLSIYSFKPICSSCVQRWVPLCVGCPSYRWWQMTCSSNIIKDLILGNIYCNKILNTYLTHQIIHMCLRVSRSNVEESNANEAWWVSKFYCSTSFALDSAHVSDHVKFDVWPGPNTKINILQVFKVMFDKIPFPHFLRFYFLSVVLTKEVHVSRYCSLCHSWTIVSRGGPLSPSTNYGWTDRIRTTKNKTN